MSEEQATPSEAEVPQRVNVKYIKSNFFRVIHADGAWGGLTPQLNIQMALFSERAAIPRRSVHEVTANGQMSRQPSEVKVRATL